MSPSEREQIIQETGIYTADEMQGIQTELAALRQYLHVVRVYGTKGYKYVPDVAPPNSDEQT